MARSSTSTESTQASWPHRLRARIRRLLAGRYTVWLVDDEERWRRYFTSTYGQDPQFKVNTFECPADVRKELNERGARPDLILVDIFYTRDPEELNKHTMSKELERLAEEADSVWDRYKKLYCADGLDFADYLSEQKVSHCLYSAKGAPFLGSNSELGRNLRRTLRRSDFVVKNDSSSIYEVEQILRLIREARILRRQRWARAKTVGWAVASAALSAWVSVNWGHIGEWFGSVIRWIFG